MFRILERAAAIPVDLDQYYRDTYSEADIAALCGRADIRTDFQPTVRERLETAAAVWRWWKAKSDEPVRNADAVKALRAVASQARKLNAAIDALPDHARSALGGHASSQLMRSILDGVRAPEAARMIIGALGADGEALSVEIDPPMLQALIEGLEQAADGGADGMRKATPGAKRDDALRMWMVNIADFWDQVSDRPFSRDVTAAGDPITEAASFCVEAFAILDPGAPQSRVLNEMKDRIQIRRKRTGRIADENRA